MNLLPFRKRKVSGSDIADGFFFEPLARAYLAGFPQCRDLLPSAAAITDAGVRSEWLFLEIFATDISTFLALGQTPAKAAILDPFWQRVTDWLGAETVPALPERLAVTGGGPRTIPPEPSETAYGRLT
jgi:hypothetical protein